MKMIKTFILKNELGLHARVAVHMVNVSNKYQAKILFEKDGTIVDGKSILGILTLACPKGGALTITAEGADADSAMDAFEELIENKFGEN